MLLTMAYGGSLGDSLFSNVSLPFLSEILERSNNFSRSSLRRRTYLSSRIIMTPYPHSSIKTLLPLQGAPDQPLFRKTIPTTHSSAASSAKTQKRCRTPVPPFQAPLASAPGLLRWSRTVRSYKTYRAGSFPRCKLTVTGCSLLYEATL